MCCVENYSYMLLGGHVKFMTCNRREFMIKLCCVKNYSYMLLGGHVKFMTCNRWVFMNTLLFFCVVVSYLIGALRWLFLRRTFKFLSKSSAVFEIGSIGSNPIRCVTWLSHEYKFSMTQSQLAIQSSKKIQIIQYATVMTCDICNNHI